ncbi:hypothetical protein F4804DRAFT_56566 [Jackrogersella minutella]|nr:hypothetical protein F4804DRAFT_56566 [Jackrogersella minutella]
MSARKSSLAYFIFAFLFSLFSLIFILIIILSGVGGHVLAEYLTVDTTNLDIPTKLGASVFLRDLSTLGGQDLVGTDTNAKSLGLSQTYSLNLLTACSEEHGSTICSTPKVGFRFDPSSDLRLDGTSIQGTFSSAYSDELQTYGKVSTFLGAGYILGALFTVSSCLSLIISRFFPETIFVSLFSSSLAFLFLLASAIASIVAFNRLENTFNGALGSSGVQTKISSKMVGLGFGAVGVTLISIVFILLLLRGSRKQGQQDGFHSKSVLPDESTPKLGLTRVTTWSRRGYMQVEKHKPVIRSHSNSPESDRRGLIATAEDDFSHENPSGFALGPMEKYDHSSRDPSVTYDPNAKPAYGSEVVTKYDPQHNYF